MISFDLASMNNLGFLSMDHCPKNCSLPGLWVKWLEMKRQDGNRQVYKRSQDACSGGSYSITWSTRPSQNASDRPPVALKIKIVSPSRLHLVIGGELKLGQPSELNQPKVAEVSFLIASLSPLFVFIKFEEALSRLSKVPFVLWSSEDPVLEGPMSTGAGPPAVTKSPASIASRNRDRAKWIVAGVTCL